MFEDAHLQQLLLYQVREMVLLKDFSSVNGTSDWIPQCGKLCERNCSAAGISIAFRAGLKWKEPFCDCL
jgi:hypothetical protein